MALIYRDTPPPPHGAPVRIREQRNCWGTRHIVEYYGTVRVGLFLTKRHRWIPYMNYSTKEAAENFVQRMNCNCLDD